jgi:hypothetical protein
MGVMSPENLAVRADRSPVIYSPPPRVTHWTVERAGKLIRTAEDKRSNWKHTSIVVHPAWGQRSSSVIIGPLLKRGLENEA